MMLLAQLLVKMPHAEIEVLLAIEPEHLLDDLHLHPPRTGPRPPPVIQPVEAHAAIGVEQPPQMPRADPQNPRRLPERQLLAPQPQNHFFSFHSPLPGARWVPHGRSSGLLVYPAWPSPRADISLANPPDISCANDSAARIIIDAIYRRMIRAAIVGNQPLRCDRHLRRRHCAEEAQAKPRRRRKDAEHVREESDRRADSHAEEIPAPLIFDGGRRIAGGRGGGSVRSSGFGAGKGGGSGFERQAEEDSKEVVQDGHEEGFGSGQEEEFKGQGEARGGAEVRSGRVPVLILRESSSNRL